MRRKGPDKKIGVAALGDCALIVRFPDNTAAFEAIHKIESAEIAGVIECTSAYDTVAVFYDPAAVANSGDIFQDLSERVRTALQRPTRRRAETAGPVVDMDVCFEDEFALDLKDVAAHTGLSAKQIVDLYCQGNYRVACIGFTPGFPYLTGLPGQLATPRRAVPRREVPGGSVAIGGDQTGIYPMASPGGWNIIGRTESRLFDAERNQPALLQPGDKVRFHAVSRGEMSRVEGSESSLKHSEPIVRADLTVIQGGPLTSVQDLGRTGYRQIGVSTGGALDAMALRVANLLAGNEAGAAGLEIIFGGVRLKFAEERIVAWAGGEFDASIPAGHAVRLRPGEELVFGQAKRGCRCWLGISGGIDVPCVLGARSTDLRARFGGLEGRPLRKGDRLSLGRSTSVRTQSETVSSWSAPVEWTHTARAEPTLRIVRGADWPRFDSSAHFTLTSVHFDVTLDSDRMGARLDGPKLQRNDEAHLISEPVAPGTIQVPPSGQPIVLLGDCQTIGGYPKIAHVITVDLPMASQLRPGDSVRFREVSLAEAHEAYLWRERDLACFRIGLQLRAS